MKQNILLIIGGLILLGVVYLVSVGGIENVTGIFTSNSGGYEMVIDKTVDCNRSSLSKTVDCLMMYTGTYRYVVTDDDIELSLSEFRDNGGDCRDFSSFYKTILTGLGYETQYIKIPQNSDYHVFLIVYGPNAYCWMDIKEYQCMVASG